MKEKPQVRLEKEIELILSEPHHPFLDTMRPFFAADKFLKFLHITDGRFGTLNPEGDIPVFDQEVLDLTKKNIESVTCTEVQRKDLSAIAYFSIWAYGTNPNIKKRFRHEIDPETGNKYPYARHTAQVAEKLTDLDWETAGLAYSHDVI